MSFLEQMIIISVRLPNVLLHSYQNFTVYFIAWLHGMNFFLALFLSWVILCSCEGRTVFCKKCNYFDSSNKNVDIAAEMLREFKTETTKEIPAFCFFITADSFPIDSSLKAILDTRICMGWRGKRKSSWKQNKKQQQQQQHFRMLLEAQQYKNPSAFS